MSVSECAIGGDTDALHDPYRDSLDRWQSRIYRWSTRTFGPRNLEFLRQHLIEETQEVLGADDEEIQGEIADLIFILMDLATVKGFYLSEAIEHKFAILKQRNWSFIDKDGIIRGDAASHSAQPISTDLSRV